MIRLIKLVTGEEVIGKEEKGILKEVALLMVIPKADGSASVRLLPYGMPHVRTMEPILSIDMKHKLVELPLDDKLKDMYVEMCTGIVRTTKMPEKSDSGIIL